MQSFLITPNDADQRLDGFLKKLFPNVSLSFLFKAIRTGKIKVMTLENNKTKQKPEYKLQQWESVNIYMSDAEISEIQKKQKIQIPVSTSERLDKNDIVHEDDQLLIINKNPGMNVHPGDNKTTEISLIQQVEDYYGWSLSSLTFKPSLIHRIDRDTSGIILIAKQKPTLTKLAADFKKKDALKKTYFTFVIWKLSRKEGTIKKNLHRIENAKNENKVQVKDSGLEAITHYKVLQEFTIKIPTGEQIISAVEVTIETGRMHQIRVHMAHIWNPILWDKTYGDKSLNSYFEKHFWVSRQMLHAWKIEFFHPERNKKMKIEARLKKDMQSFLDRIKN